MAIAEQNIADELGVKLSREQQEKLRQAATLTGTSLSDFAATALVQAADAVLDTQPRLLSERDFDLLVNRLEADASPNQALQSAAEEYKRRLADGSLQTCG